jgi:hypothetical protein
MPIIPDCSSGHDYEIKTIGYRYFRVCRRCDVSFVLKNAGATNIEGFPPLWQEVEVAYLATDDDSQEESEQTDVLQ